MTGADSALPIWTDFMSAALQAHPDWGGDWQQPPDIEQADIDPHTGLLAAPDTTTKRTELFVRSTAPQHPTVEATPEEDLTNPDLKTHAPNNTLHTTHTHQIPTQHAESATPLKRGH